eukprot:7200890-Prymnesium_polylepis.1
MASAMTARQKATVEVAVSQGKMNERQRVIWTGDPIMCEFDLEPCCVIPPDESPMKNMRQQGIRAQRVVSDMESDI